MQKIIDVINKEINKENNVLLFTGDKGSSLLMRVVEEMNVNIIFINTGYHFYEIMEYAKGLEEKLKIIKNCDASIDYTANMNECCSQRKRNILKEYLGIANAECLIVPFRDEEKGNGIEDSYLSGIDNIKIIRPLADLTERDIWMKIREFKLPFSRIYNKGYRIVDCKPCTTRFGRKKHDSDADSGDIDNETKEKLISLGYM